MCIHNIKMIDNILKMFSLHMMKKHEHLIIIRSDNYKHLLHSRVKSIDIMSLNPSIIPL